MTQLHHKFMTAETNKPHGSFYRTSTAEIKRQQKLKAYMCGKTNIFPVLNEYSRPRLDMIGYIKSKILPKFAREKRLRNLQFKIT